MGKRVKRGTGNGLRYPVQRTSYREPQDSSWGKLGETGFMGEYIFMRERQYLIQVFIRDACATPDQSGDRSGLFPFNGGGGFL
jgi:hypothetical protein